MKDKRIKEVVKSEINKPSHSINTSKLIAWILGLVLISTLLVGGSYLSKLNSSLRNSEKNNINLNAQISKTQEEKAIAEKDISICKSDTPGWRKDFFTIKFEGPKFGPNGKINEIAKKELSFSMEFPEEWRESKGGYVFYNNPHGKEEVIAMTIPNILSLDYKCTNIENSKENFAANGIQTWALLDEKDIKIAERPGKLITSKYRTKVDDFSKWHYKASYCLMEKDLSFNVTFYSMNEKWIVDQHHEKILSTIKFEE